MTANILFLTHQLFNRTAAPEIRIPGRATPQAQTLLKWQVLRVHRPLGREVHCDSGTLWLTFDHDLRDVVLEAGQTYRCQLNTLMIMQALDDARLRIE
jgi:hypothetical protein